MMVKARLILGAVVLLALAALPASASAVTATKHHLVMYKVEKQVSLGESQTASPTVSCNGSDYATDGMWRIDSVGHFNPQLADPDEVDAGGWNIATGVDVLAAYPSSSSTYTFTFYNSTSEDAQLKIFITCLGTKTAPDTEQHSLLVTKAKYAGSPASHYDASAPANSAWNTLSSATAKCDTNQIFISPGFKLTNGSSARLFASRPGNSDPSVITDWTWGFYTGPDPVTVRLYGRCLKLSTGKTNDHAHKLYAELKTDAEYFDKGQYVAEHQIACDDDAKGLIGGFSVWEPGASYDHPHQYWLGMDPRIKTRAYKTYNTGDTGSYYLVCVNDRTSRPLY
jgi:hypothetical protein